MLVRKASVVEEKNKEKSDYITKINSAYM